MIGKTVMGLFLFRNRGNMKKSEVKVGGYYICNVSGKRVVVRIDSCQESFYRGKKQTHYWLGTNLLTNRQIHISSAARLQKEVSQLTAEILGKTWKG